MIVHFFDGASAILFVVSLSCYDEVPFEEVLDLDIDLGTKNNMVESLEVKIKFDLIFLILCLFFNLVCVCVYIFFV